MLLLFQLHWQEDKFQVARARPGRLLNAPGIGNDNDAGKKLASLGNQHLFLGLELCAPTVPVWIHKQACYATQL